MPSRSWTKRGRLVEANCSLVEIEEVAQVDADPPPQSSPAEDAAADALAAPSNCVNQQRGHSARTAAEAPSAAGVGAPAAPVPAVVGAAVEPPNSPLAENEEEDAYVNPPQSFSPEEDAAADALAAPSPDSEGTYEDPPQPSSPAEDAAADALAALSADNEGAQSPLRRAPPTAAAEPAAPAAQVPTAAVAAVEPALGAALTLPSHCQSLQRERKRLNGV